MKNISIFRLSQIVMGSFLSLIFVISVASAAQDSFAEGPEWLWSARVAEINQTTQALATGHATRALRFASTLQAENLSAAESLIAAHNLCLALVATQSTQADRACREAVRTVLPDAEDRVLFVRGAWTVGVDVPGGSAARLTHLVRANIAQAYGIRIVDRFAEEPW